METAGATGTATDSATVSVAVPNVTYKDTLNIAVAQQAPSLDLHKNSSLIARQMMDGICWEKLVTLNANGEAVPELCESYEVSEDAKTITFALRKGVKFHYGSEMTADDVDRVSGLDGVTVYSTQQGTIAPIINHKEDLCTNQWFRQAVSYALDYEEVMTATYGTNGFTTGSCYMDEAQPFWYTDAGLEEYNVHDPEKAKEILKAMDTTGLR